RATVAASAWPLNPTITRTSSARAAPASATNANALATTRTLRRIRSSTRVKRGRIHALGAFPAFAPEQGGPTYGRTGGVGPPPPAGGASPPPPGKLTWALHTPTPHRAPGP